ncbi:MAG: DegT/DnrJ/EryC1/StrS family aminotransferase [Pyrinomonadaceae bacterium]
MIKVPLSAPDITETEIKAVGDVLRTPTLSLGPQLAEFERRIAAYVDAPHAVAVSSGTAGLHLCVRAFRITDGDEVITTPFSFIAPANVLLYERAVPVFVDIDPATLNIDPAKIESAITAKTKAIMVVHVFGRPAPMREIMSIAARHNLIVIEDACEALGAEYDGQKAGAMGDAGVFAFYPNKQITTGEGGAIVTSNLSISKFAKELRNQGRDQSLDWFEHHELGYNYRISDINCALGIAQLQRLDDILAMRAAAARAYHTRLAADARLMTPDLQIDHGRVSWFVYVVRLSRDFSRRDRDDIVRAMESRGIKCGRYFAPIHLQPLYVKRFGYANGDYPEAERAAERTIALPFFNRITAQQVNEVCDELTVCLDEISHGM